MTDQISNPPLPRSTLEQQALVQLSALQDLVTDPEQYLKGRVPGTRALAFQLGGVHALVHRAAYLSDLEDALDCFIRFEGRMARGDVGAPHRAREPLRSAIDQVHHTLRNIIARWQLDHGPSAPLCRIDVIESEPKDYYPDLVETTWYGFDFDGTMTQHLGPDWRTYPIGSHGDPHHSMLDRMRQYLQEGKSVKIVTARADPNFPYREVAITAVRSFLAEHAPDLAHLEITSSKGVGMAELWDDVAKRVDPQTGEPCPGCSGDGITLTFEEARELLECVRECPGGWGHLVDLLYGKLGQNAWEDET